METILIAINVRWWNAEAHYALNLAQGLEDLGHAVTLLVNPESPVEKKAAERGITTINDILLDSKSLFVQAENYKKLVALVKEKRFTVLHSFKSSGGLLFSLVNQAFRPTIHIKTRGEARPPKLNWGNRLLYGPWGANGVVSVGRSVSKWIDGLQLEEQNRTLIHYGMKPMAEPAEKRPNPLNLPKNAKLITLLGRTQEVKGHSLLLEAFSQLEDKSCHLLFLVKILDEFPEVLEHLTNRIKELDLKDRVHILGGQASLDDWLEATDLAAIPSLSSEVNCRTTVEFMGKGVPLVVFPTGSLTDIIKHKKNGFVCADQSILALKKGLAWMLEDEARLKELGAQAKVDFTENYSQEKMANDYLEFYGQVRG